MIKNIMIMGLSILVISLGSAIWFQAHEIDNLRATINDQLGLVERRTETLRDSIELNLEQYQTIVSQRELINKMKILLGIDEEMDDKTQEEAKKKELLMDGFGV